MNGSRLNRKLTLEAPLNLPDGAGGYEVSWRALGTVWADVTSVSGQEVFAGETSRNRTQHRVVVRAAPPESNRRPKAHQRFREGNRVFRILSVIEHDPKHRFLRCMVEEEQTL